MVPYHVIVLNISQMKRKTEELPESVILQIYVLLHTY